MKATELRIGNYLRIRASDSCVQIEYDDLRPSRILNYNPIPLTEEWLLKFGFERQINKPFADYVLPNWGICYDVDTNTYFWYDWDKLEIKYVHQLQNLYFALTGEELKMVS